MALNFIFHLAEGAFLWFLAYMVAPAGYQISIWRGVTAAILTTIASWLLPPFLKPLIGDWHLLAAFLTFVLIVKFILGLSFWRSVLVVVIDCVAILAVGYFIIDKLGVHNAT